jgi:hypothetical protein
MDFVNRDFNAAINIIRYAVLRTRPEELTLLKFAGQCVMVEVHKEKLKPGAGEGPTNARRRLPMGIHYPYTVVECFCCTGRLCVYPMRLLWAQSSSSTKRCLPPRWHQGGSLVEAFPLTEPEHDKLT